MEEHKGRGNQGYDAKCKLYQEEDEDIVHFTVKCKKVDLKRDYTIIDRNIGDPGERLRALLFINKNYLMVSKMLRGLWDLRKNLLKLELEKMKRIENPRVQNTPNLEYDENPCVQKHT